MSALHSLSDVHRSISVPKNASFLRKLLAFTGPGYLIAVGYMDPGNWATDLAGGSAYGYTLLSVILISSGIAMVLQYLSVKLGIVTGRDLAQLCREAFPRWVIVPLWLLAEIMIVACDLAEVIGTAIGLQLLFNIPLPVGVVMTALDVVVLLFLQKRGFRWLEAIVISLIVLVVACFGLELFFSHPAFLPMLHGFLPTPTLFTHKQMLFVAVGIIGATVMPHSLYLHSAVVQTRDHDGTVAGKKEAVKFASIDSTIALTLAFFVNAAILIVAAAVFYMSGHETIAEISDAYKLLAPLLGTSVASVIFAVALLASGQNSTVTATMAGQVILEGFMNLTMKPWLRRLVTRSLAIVPAVVIAIMFGGSGVSHLLIISQVVLSMQLPFAIVPLVYFTSSKKYMGEFVSKPWLKAVVVTIAGLIIVLNVGLVTQSLTANL